MSQVSSTRTGFLLPCRDTRGPLRMPVFGDAAAGRRKRIPGVTNLFRKGRVQGWGIAPYYGVPYNTGRTPADETTRRVRESEPHGLCGPLPGGPGDTPETQTKTSAPSRTPATAPTETTGERT